MNGIIPYLTIEMQRTKTKGPHAVNGPNGLISGMDIRIALMRK